MSLYHDTLRSARWRRLKWRRVVFAGFCCELCGARYVGKRPKGAMRFFELHHGDLTTGRYPRVGREHLEDVRIVCPRCHAEIHGVAA